MEEGNSRRESIMSSFHDCDISEGTRNLIPNGLLDFTINKKLCARQSETKRVFEVRKPAHMTNDVLVMSSDINNQRDKDESKVIILSRIDHVHTQHNESKNSEIELEMLLNMTTVEREEPISLCKEQP
jgi:hypothetical protein